MRRFAPCFLAFALLSSPLPAREAVQAWPMPPVQFFVEHMPQPPKTGDPADVADLQYVLAKQACATPEQIARARFTSKLDLFAIYRDVLGRGFTPQRFPRTAALLERLAATSESVKEGLKAHFHRARPVDAHAKDGVVGYVKHDPSYTYPSGHALRGWLSALVLAELAPDKRQQLIGCGAGIGSDRIVAGMHYQTDVIASRSVANLIFSKLAADSGFVRELAAAKAEWSKRD